MLSDEETISDDSFCYALVYLFKKNGQETGINTIRDITSNLYHITRHNNMSQLTLITYILSFFNIVQLQIPVN